MAEQSTLPAVTVVPLRIGGQELMLPDKAQEFLVKKTAKGWEIQESAELGNNSVFVKRDGAGVVRLIYKQVPLAVAKKEVVGIKGSMTITIGGYNRCNQIAGLHIVTPPSITVDGVEQGNPAVIRNEKGEKVRVVARKIIIGYSPNGNLVAIDSVRHYDFEAYYLQDLHAKTAIPDAARFGTSVLCPFDPEAEILEKGSTIYARKAGKIWVFKAIKDIEGIWMDMAHKEIAEVYSQHIQHQKFGEVIAQSLATRNGLKAHPAISAQQVIVQNGVAKVLVYGYRHDTTAQEFEEMGKQIVAGEQPEGAQVIHDEGVANFEEVQAIAETEADDGTPENATPTPEEAPTKPAPEAQADQGGQLQRIIDLAKACDPVVDLDTFCGNMFKAKPQNLDEAQRTKLIGVLEKMAKKGGKK